MHARVTVRIPPELEAAMRIRKAVKGETYPQQFIHALARQLGVALVAEVKPGRQPKAIAEQREKMKPRPRAARRLQPSEYAF